MHLSHRHHVDGAPQAANWVDVGVIAPRAAVRRSQNFFESCSTNVLLPLVQTRYLAFRSLYARSYQQRLLAGIDCDGHSLEDRAVHVSEVPAAATSQPGAPIDSECSRSVYGTVEPASPEVAAFEEWTPYADAVVKKISSCSGLTVRPSRVRR